METTLSTAAAVGSLVLGACAASQGQPHTGLEADHDEDRARTAAAAPLQGASTVDPEEPLGGYGHHQSELVGYLVYIDSQEGGGSADDRLAADSTEPGTPGAKMDACGPVEVYFEREAHELPDAAQATLNRFASCVQTVEHVRVEEADANTLDHVGPGPAPSPSKDLSRQRAKAVKRYLRSKATPQDLKPEVDPTDND